MNESQKMQKEAAHSLSMRCTTGLDASFSRNDGMKANEMGDGECIAVSEKNRAQGMRAEMGEKI